MSDFWCRIWIDAELVSTRWRYGFFQNMHWWSLDVPMSLSVPMSEDLMIHLNGLRCLPLLTRAKNKSYTQNGCPKKVPEQKYQRSQTERKHSMVAIPIKLTKRVLERIYPLLPLQHRFFCITFLSEPTEVLMNHPKLFLRSWFIHNAENAPTIRSKLKLSHQSI